MGSRRTFGAAILLHLFANSCSSDGSVRDPLVMGASSDSGQVETGNQSEAGTGDLVWAGGTQSLCTYRDESTIVATTLLVTGSSPECHQCAASQTARSACLVEGEECHYVYVQTGLPDPTRDGTDAALCRCERQDTGHLEFACQL